MNPVPPSDPIAPALIDGFLATNEAIEVTATLAADLIATTTPGVNRDQLQHVIATDMWYAIQDMARLCRSGAQLA